MKRQLRESLPKVLSILIFLSGLMNIFSSFYAREFSRIELVTDFFPLQLSLASRTLTILAGLTLMYLAGGIWQRKRRSLIIAIGVLLVSAIFNLVKGADYEEALVCVTLASLFFVLRGYFFILSGTIQVWQRIRTAAVIITTLFLYILLGYVLLWHDFREAISLPLIGKSFLHNAFALGPESLHAVNRYGRWFHNSVAVVSLASYVFVVTALFAPKRFLNHLRKEHEPFFRTLLHTYGKNTISVFTLMNDKQNYIFSDDKAFTAYKISQDSCIVLGDPLCRESEITERIQEFQKAMNHYGFQVGYAYIESRTLSYYEKAGYKKLHLGDEAIIPLSAFTLEGSEMKDVRNAYNKMQRLGVTPEWFSFSALPDSLRKEVEALHHTWKKTKGRLNLTFSMDFYPLPEKVEGYLEVLRSTEGKLLAALSFQSVGGETMIMDLFIREPAAPNGIMETAIVYAAQFFKDHQKNRLSLGLVGLSSLSGEQQTLFSQSAKVVIQKILRVYNYESLQRFKQKFMPAWEPRYFVYQKGANLPKLLAGLLSVHLKG